MTPLLARFVHGPADGLRTALGFVSATGTSDREVRRAALGLLALLALLVAGALLPRLGASLGLSALAASGANASPLPVLLAAVVAVAAFGGRSIRLRRRCRALERARDADSHAALHDPLTGAANRRHFEQVLDRLVADDGATHALLMIDLDRFKPVNDLYGHAAGDALLQGIATGLARLLRPSDLLARLGGDEFAVLLTRSGETRNERTALAVLDFVAKYRLNWQDQRIGVGASIGLVAVDRPGLRPAELLAAADEALYAAKEAGRGAAFLAAPEPGVDALPALRRLDAGAPDVVSSARSHEPEDGRQSVLQGLVMASLPGGDGACDARIRRGSRRRHEIAHWVAVEPMTLGEADSPGLAMRELLEGAAARGDGGADFARWVLVTTLGAVARLSPSNAGRIGFALPLPARAVVAVPSLAEELLRINALSHRPIRHLAYVLHGVGPVHDEPALADFHRRLHTSGVRLGFEIRASTLDVLAPLRHVPYDELHLGRELVRNVRPGNSGHAAVETLLTVAERSGATLVASGVDAVETVRQLGMVGVERFTGPAVVPPEPLHDVLQRLSRPC